METNNETLAIECPNCNAEMNITFEDLGTTVTCEKCKAPLSLEDLGIGSALEDAGGRMKEMFGKMFEN